MCTCGCVYKNTCILHKRLTSIGEHSVLDDDLVCVEGFCKHFIGCILICQIEEHLWERGRPSDDYFRFTLIHIRSKHNSNSNINMTVPMFLQTPSDDHDTNTGYAEDDYDNECLSSSL